ncbi:hypothetical protein, partial [Photobacterium iliopiscarium]|uniref:hypothetical protein n=1 Tax=Photobacterium iliopiscarium TaxID=56192 RepID=UPI000D469CE8
LSHECIPKTNKIVTADPILTKESESEAVTLPIERPNAIANKIPTNKHNEKIALFLDDNPIAIEYIDAVIAKVASVGHPFIFNASINNGRRGTSI